jgi:hypothetical protein
MSKRSLPWLQFYPSDWLSDSVAGCSLAAQGLWFRMLFVAHNSQRYGYLEADGRAIPDEQLGRRCGCANVEGYRTLLAELFSAGVPSRTPEGVIYSRRMVRDQQDRDATAQRVRRHRERAACNAPVTPMPQGEVRSQRSEVRDQKSKSESKAKAREGKTRVAKPAPPGDPRFSPFVEFAYRAFEEKHGVKPSWLGKDFEQLRLLLKANPSLGGEELERRWRAYLDCTEPFISKQGDSLAYFASHCDTFCNGPISQSKGKADASNYGDANERLRQSLTNLGFNNQAKPS